MRGEARTDDGDTLIEILITLVIIGTAAVALLNAFATTIRSSGEYRSLVKNATVLTSVEETTISQIERQFSPLYVTCANSADYQNSVVFHLPSGYTVNFNSVTYWGQKSSGAYGFSSTNNCSSNPPQLIGLTVVPPNGSPLSDYFVVSDNGG